MIFLRLPRRSLNVPMMSVVSVAVIALKATIMEITFGLGEITSLT